MYIPSLIDFVNDNKLSEKNYVINFKKAYDWVGLEFLIVSLRYFNFGDKFIK